MTTESISLTAVSSSNALPTQISEAVNSLLGPLLAGQTNLSGKGTFPWQHSGTTKNENQNFFFQSWTLDQLPGLVIQCRGALFANVSQVSCRIRKIPGADITWRVFVCADQDIDPGSFKSESLVDFIRNHPGAVPQYTIDKDTTQSTLVFDVDWLIGLATSVNYTLPPLRTPRLIIFAESTTSIKDKYVAWAWHGKVEIGGYGYIGGYVERAPAATT